MYVCVYRNSDIDIVKEMCVLPWLLLPWLLLIDTGQELSEATIAKLEPIATILKVPT